MKNLFLSFVLVMVSLVAKSQLPSHLNLEEIQKEFMILYYKRCDSLGHKIVEDKSLICMTECQVNYLKNLNFISHEQEVNSKFYSLDDRLTYFYPVMSKTSDVHVGEVISLIGTGKTIHLKTNKELAIRLFNCFMRSESHREIMDNKEFTKVNFKVEINKDNSIFIVGVLSNKLLR